MSKIEILLWLCKEDIINTINHESVDVIPHGQSGNENEPETPLNHLHSETDSDQHSEQIRDEQLLNCDPQSTTHNL